MRRWLLAFLLATTPALAATPTNTTIASYHGAPDRAGSYIVPGLNWQSARTVHRAQDFDGRIDGHVYAQPLYWRPNGTDHGFIIAATESDGVYALDAQTGRIVWRAQLGHPVPLDALSCGNIDPLGITGTPVIDDRRGAIYLDAMVDDYGKPRHFIYGLRLTDGAVLPGFPLDVTAGLASRGIRFNPVVQNQRAALALLNGRIVVAFGGHYGDCGQYHGVVVGIDTASPAISAAWQTRAAKGGIWAPAGISEADGSLYFATGNTDGAREWQDGNGVFRVGPDLAHLTDPRSVFAPSNWKQMDDDDLDLGGVAPLPLSPPGSQTRLLLALGKDGNAYLLNRDNLGGFGGAIATYKAARGAIITAPAVWAMQGALFVAYQARGAACPNGSTVSGLGVLAVTAAREPKLSSAWCARLDGRGAPIVTTTDGASQPIVWAVGAEGDDRLHGYRGDTGEAMYTGGGAADGMDKLRHFVTILAAEGRFYVAGDGRIFAFDLPR